MKYSGRPASHQLRTRNSPNRTLRPRTVDPASTAERELTAREREPAVTVPSMTPVAFAGSKAWNEVHCRVPTAAGSKRGSAIQMSSEAQMSADVAISFLSHLQAKLYEVATRDLEQNHEADRYGPEPKRTLGHDMQEHQNKLLAMARLKNSKALPLILLDTWQLLQDEYSKDVLLELYLQRVIGHDLVKLFRNSPKYWKERSLARSLQTNRLPAKKIRNMNFELTHFDLKDIGYDLNLFSAPIGIDATFLKTQYEYSGVKPAIAAKAGDIVIEAGSCYGDTSLYFATKVGPEGKVIGFEFIPENLDILRQNLELNPKYASNIEIIERPVWETSEKILYMMNNGPGSQVSERPLFQGAVEVKTISIDDMVRERNLPRVDFIKMDIEGAELSALKGAVGTLERFKPSLAICVYHKPNDWVDIPLFINSLNLGYKMWLDHFTIYPEETVLYCRTF
ncbi:FkbM family methyltransferase [Bradyrhizobium sp. B117]|uniref:FkbM family methyltransferase n=1 Tax=Bradyrhizobium sp. B117 TaxID=3140246 RepID=UPI00318370F7